MVYDFKPGCHITNVDPQDAGEECAKLEEKGELTPENLVKVSTPEDAPLHAYFLWDDKECGVLYREHQAGHLIRCITIKIERVNEPVRAYMPTAPEGGGKRTYRNTEYVMTNVETRDAVLGDAIRELNSFRHKYSQLKELAGVFSAIDQLDLGLDETA